MNTLTGRILENKRALVTGGSRGLGRAVCEVFAAEGARVAFTYNRDDEGAKQTCAALLHRGADAKSFKVSVLDYEGTEKAVSDIDEHWGGIDILVNNSGISQNLPIALMEEADWDMIMDVNVKGTFLTSKAVLRTMIRQKRGVILNIGSLAGMRMIEAPVHYYTSKAAVKGLTEALAKEVARYGIRVLCLAPGLLEDGLSRNLPEHRVAEYLENCSLGRLGTLEETARFAAFLVSDANSYMSGASVVMDGAV